MTFARFSDPHGQRHALPSWPWGHAPAHPATKKQLAAQGQRPGGQHPAGQLLWHSRRAPRTSAGIRTALLYDSRLAKPKRVPSPAVLASLERAMAARRTCPACHQVFPFCLPTSLGQCPDCHHTAMTRPDWGEETERNAA